MNTTKQLILSFSRPVGFDVDIIRVNSDGDYQSFLKTLGWRKSEADAKELAKLKSRELGIPFKA